MFSGLSFNYQGHALYTPFGAMEKNQFFINHTFPLCSLGRYELWNCWNWSCGFAWGKCQCPAGPALPLGTIRGIWWSHRCYLWKCSGNKQGRGQVRRGAISSLRLRSHSVCPLWERSQRSDTFLAVLSACVLIPSSHWDLLSVQVKHCR